MAENQQFLFSAAESPKNFALQTEPQIQEVLGIDEKDDYFATSYRRSSGHGRTFQMQRRLKR